MRTRLGAAAGLAAIALLLSGCTASGSGLDGEPVEVDFALPDAGSLTSLGDAGWSSGVMFAVDELIGMLPELAPLRDEIAADDAAFGQSVVESFGLDGSGLAQSLAGGGQSRPVRAISDGQVLGNVLVGGFAPDVVSAAMDQVDEGQLGDQDSVSENGQTVTRDEDGDVSVVLERESQAGGSGGTAHAAESVRYDGTFCPGPDGRFDAIVQTSRNATGTGSAGGASYQQDVRVEAVGVLGEDAAPESMDVTVSQRTTRTDAAGSTTAVATAQHADWASWGGGSGLAPGGNAPRKTEDSIGSSEDVAQLVTDGQSQGDAIALGLVSNLMRTWSDGGCVRIDTDAPARVQPKSTTDFTIRVLRKVTDTEVTGPLHLTLAGEHDVDPKESVSTGGFHYTAEKQGTTGELTIVATSRQGGAKLTHTFTTQAVYRVTGGWTGFAVDTTICGADVFSTPAWGLQLAAGGGGYAFSGSTIGMSYDGGDGHILGLQGSWTLAVDEDGAPSGIDAQVSGMEATGAGTTHPNVTPIVMQSIHFDITPSDDASACG
ncbi:hypothetical protein [Protaetiibacter mangrovi]|uniref:Uncharacterized protein n=2 Tax=Microbacteriaceae TaxID=85023 RepID=A0ABT1ZDT0_9MICO|nr:hypothetical protein [Protaetiibacter mangrovi]MCS0498855.1 hypothetical protein [Protaetiibacter mangrovi]TPX05113.1 hypothetical protein FJ656_08280 [Schumannella luteola]